MTPHHGQADQQADEQVAEELEVERPQRPVPGAGVRDGGRRARHVVRVDPQGQVPQDVCGWAGRRREEAAPVAPLRGPGDRCEDAGRDDQAHDERRVDPGDPQDEVPPERVGEPARGDEVPADGEEAEHRPAAEVLALDRRSGPGPGQVVAMGHEDQQGQTEPDQVEGVVADVQLDGPTAGPRSERGGFSGDGRPTG